MYLSFLQRPNSLLQQLECVRWSKCILTMLFFSPLSFLSCLNKTIQYSTRGFSKKLRRDVLVFLQPAWGLRSKCSLTSSMLRLQSEQIFFLESNDRWPFVSSCVSSLLACFCLFIYLFLWSETRKQQPVESMSQAAGGDTQRVTPTVCQNTTRLSPDWRILANGGWVASWRR